MTRVLFANVPFIRYDNGQIRTGPNAGSRWPWTLPGHTCYACFPFRLAEATSYLAAHGIDAWFYDGVALKHWDYPTVVAKLVKCKPDMLVLEIAAPLEQEVLDVAAAVKAQTGCKVVLVGPHCSAAATTLLDHADHVVKGEYEIPCLQIAQGSTQRLWEYVHVEDIDILPNSQNWLPFRPYDYLHNYLEPTMATPAVQLQVNTSRGCSMGCKYCLWPQTLNAPDWKTKNKQGRIGGYRARSVPNVLDEIRTVIAKSPRPIGSILFDDDTWNMGGLPRIGPLCEGLKQIGLPWTMMGRIDIHGMELFDLMRDSGCIGMRFGLESFQQPLLDCIGGHRNGQKNFDHAMAMVTRYRNFQFHFTTMQDLPGETPEQQADDDARLLAIREAGEAAGNVVHWQRSSMVAFPGTEMAKMHHTALDGMETVMPTDAVPLTVRGA